MFNIYCLFFSRKFAYEIPWWHPGKCYYGNGLSGQWPVARSRDIVSGRRESRSAGEPRWLIYVDSRIIARRGSGQGTLLSKQMAERAETFSALSADCHVPEDVVLEGTLQGGTSTLLKLLDPVGCTEPLKRRCQKEAFVQQWTGWIFRLK